MGIVYGLHPRWCAPARCEFSLGGAHTSHPVVIRSDATSDARASVRVWEHRETAFEPSITYVELILGNHATNERIRADLSLAQARALIDTLSEALQSASDDVELTGDGAEVTVGAAPVASVTHLARGAERPR